MGSAALNLCMVASGKADAYFEAGPHCWDFAAGALIAEEAGAVAYDLKGNLSIFIRSIKTVDKEVYCRWKRSVCVGVCY